MTQLSDKDHKAQMEDMKSFDEQMPCVGIFWYDPQDNTLFGVRKKELTPQMVEEAANQGGCVVWNVDKFEVRVGLWAEPIFDELTELIEKEFSLPYFEFVYDEHWDLGHGWSGDMPK